MRWSDQGPIWPMTMKETVEKYGDWAHGGEPEATAQQWTDAGFAVDEADRWLSAGVYELRAATQMRSEGYTPEQAARPLPEETFFRTGLSKAGGLWILGYPDLAREVMGPPSHPRDDD